MEDLKKFLLENREVFNWKGLERKFGLSKSCIKNFTQQGYLSKENKTLLLNGLAETLKNLPTFHNPNLDCNV